MPRASAPTSLPIHSASGNSSEAYARTTLVPSAVATRPSSLPRRLDTAVLGKPKTVKHRGRTRTTQGIYKGARSPLVHVFFGFRRSRNSVSFDVRQRNEQRTLYNQNTLFALSFYEKLFQKIPTFFQKPLDKSKIIVYNIPRYPKTAGFRKSVPLSCRGRRQFNPSGVLRPFFAQSFGTDGESFLFL